MSEAEETYKRLSPPSSTRCSAMAERPDCRRVRLLGLLRRAERPCGNCEQLPVAAAGARRQLRRQESCCRASTAASRRAASAFAATHIIDVLRGKLTDKV